MNDFSQSMTGGEASPELGAGIYKILRVSTSDLALPQTKDKLIEIVDFAGGFDDALHLMKMAMQKKPFDMPSIDFMHEFVLLRKEHVTVTKRMMQLKKELSRYE